MIWRKIHEEIIKEEEQYDKLPPMARKDHKFAKHHGDVSGFRNFFTFEPGQESWPTHSLRKTWPHFDPKTHAKAQLAEASSLPEAYEGLRSKHSEVAQQIGQMLGFSYRDFILVADSLSEFDKAIHGAEDLLSAYGGDIQDFTSLAGEVAYRRSTK